MKLTIIIPCYNEAATIYEVLGRVCSVPLKDVTEKEIIVVNDFSTDATPERIKDFMNDHAADGVRYICHEKNMGKGAAIRSGIENATGDYTIIQDADLELDPEDI